MTEPKRWSSPSSEVDPVLRSVLLYARDVQPDSRQLQAILRGSARPATPKRRRFAAFVVAAAAVACAGVAWAGYASGLLFSSAPNPSSAAPASSATLPATGRASRGAVDSAARGAVDVAPRIADSASPLAKPLPEAAVVVAAPPVVVDRAAPRVAPSTPRAAPSTASEQDAALLQQARLIVASEPARALTLTRDHELHFPASALTEERQALRIEALARLGRRPEATRALATFDQYFPRSIYRHRLHALLSD